ncbi:mitochondrial chaperone BCS1, partial [Paraphaeosphaeria sporulosa]
MASSGEFNASHIQSLLSEQTPFLNLFFPGLAPVTSSLWALLTVIPNGYGGLLCFCGLLLAFGKYTSQYVASLLETYFTTTIYVPYSDEAYDMLISWVCAQPFAQSARTSLVS